MLEFNRISINWETDEVKREGNYSIMISYRGNGSVKSNYRKLYIRLRKE